MWSLKITLLVLLSIGSSSLVEVTLREQEKHEEIQPVTLYNNNNNNNNNKNNNKNNNNTAQHGGSQMETGSEEPPSGMTVNCSILDLRSNEPLQVTTTLEHNSGQLLANEARVERRKRSIRGSQESGGGKRKKRRAGKRGRGARGKKRDRRPRKKQPKPKKVVEIKKKVEDQKNSAKSQIKEQKKLMEKQPKKKKSKKTQLQQKRVMEMKKMLEDRKKNAKTLQKINMKEAARGPLRGNNGKTTGKGKKKEVVETEKNMTEVRKAAKKARPPVSSRRKQSSRKTSSRRPTKSRRRKNRTKAHRQKTKGVHGAGVPKVTQKKKESPRERQNEPHGTRGPKVKQKKKDSHRERTHGKVKQEKNKEQETNGASIGEGEGKGNTMASPTTDEGTNQLLGVLKTEMLSEKDAQDRKEKSGHNNWKLIFEKAIEDMAQGRRRVESGLLAFNVAPNALASEETSSGVEWGKALVQQGLQIVKEGEQQLKDWLGLDLRPPGMSTSKQSPAQDKEIGLKEQSGGTNRDDGRQESTDMDWLVRRAKSSVDGVNQGSNEANKENKKDGKNAKKIQAAVNDGLAGGVKEGTGALGKLREGLNKIKEGLSLQEDGQKTGTKSSGKQDKAKVQQGLEEMKEGVGDVEEGLNVVMVGKKEVEEGVRDIGDSTEKEGRGEDVASEGEDDLRKYLEGWGLDGVRHFPISPGGNPYVDPTPTEREMFPGRKETIVSTSPKAAQRTLFYPSYLQVPQAGTVPTSSARSAPEQGGKTLPVTKSADGKSVGEKRQAKGGPTVPTSLSSDDLLKEIKELQHEVVELEAKGTGKGQSKRGRRHE